MTGPVQVLVVGFDDPTFSGDVLAELDRLGDAGIVRLVDVVVVARDDAGGFETVEPPAGAGGERGRVAAALLGDEDGDPAGADGDHGAAWSLADAVPPGSRAAIALVEHVWAGPLMDAIRRSGGTPLEETWLAPADVDALDRLVAKRSG